MNHATDCHEIPDCPGIFVDAFRGAYLTHKTKDAANVFVLSHYHGDHYGSLPREGNYQGPAQIHCTPVTAALLVRVHGIHESLVVSHKLGETFSVPDQGQQEQTRITFYDANHCPGAAIILFQASNDKVHLHTGDMRYHARMQSYPLLRQFASQRLIDTVLLDTTYAHPKHTFCSQQEAVNQIASSVQDLLQPNQPKTLVLLSCYSIGKEKVLWQTARQTGRKIYATEKKRRMLECLLQTCDSGDAADAADDDDDDYDYASNPVCWRILEHCTADPTESDIHIIPMGLAGQMWPFFQPNYKACLEYAQQQEAAYKRVVAFLPTGWADASKWNKKNACKTVVMDGVTVSVRLVAYSEHSTFDELQKMVKFLQPRVVIPTVYSDEKDRVKIQARFRAWIDTKRAKQAFFQSMTMSASKPSKNTCKAEPQGELDVSTGDRAAIASTQNSASSPTPSPSAAHVVDLLSDSESDTDTRKIDPTSCKRALPLESDEMISKRPKNTNVDCLVSMGFSEEDAEKALETTSDVSAAIETLLRPPRATQHKPRVASPFKSRVKNSKGSPSKIEGMQSIAKFFSVKKS